MAVEGAVPHRSNPWKTRIAGVQSQANKARQRTILPIGVPESLKFLVAISLALVVPVYVWRRRIYALADKNTLQNTKAKAI